MGQSPDGSGFGWPLLLGGAVAGVIGGMPAVVAYLQLTEPEQLHDNPSLWYLAAAAPVVALLVAVRAGGWPDRAALTTVIRRAAALLGGTVAAAMVVLVVAGRSLDADGPGRSAVAAYGVAALAMVVGAVLLRRRRPAARSRRQDGRARPYDVNATPRPGEIWWGVVPFDEGEGSTHRPFVVLSVRGRTLTVLSITTNDISRWKDCLPFHPAPESGLEPGFVEMRACEIDVRDVDRRRQPSPCPKQLWRKVQARFGPPPQRSAPPRPPAGRSSGRPGPRSSSTGRH